MTLKSEISDIIEPLRSQFMIMKECLACKRQISDESIKIVAEESNSYMLHQTCPHCENALVLVASINDIGVGLVGMISDLTYEDAGRLYNNEPIDEEFLLEAYQILHKISFNKYLNLK